MPETGKALVSRGFPAFTAFCFGAGAGGKTVKNDQPSQTRPQRTNIPNPPPHKSERPSKSKKRFKKRTPFRNGV